jgi:hypothetical protein
MRGGHGKRLKNLRRARRLWNWEDGEVDFPGKNLFDVENPRTLEQGTISITIKNGNRMGSSLADMN